MAVTLALVVVALIAQHVLLDQLHRRERTRLIRIAVAETKAERVAALMPERKVKPASAREPRSKPIGL